MVGSPNAATEFQGRSGMIVTLKKTDASPCLVDIRSHADREHNTRKRRFTSGLQRCRCGLPSRKFAC